MVYLDPENNREEALNALETAGEWKNPTMQVAGTIRALVFAVLDVAAAIRESNAKPTEIGDNP